MRTIARLAGTGMLLAACSADPLGGGGQAGAGDASYDATETGRLDGTHQIAISGTGTGQVIACSGSDACQWSFTGTATGSPLEGAVSIVVEIETGGTWDASGCQPISGGSVSLHRRGGQRVSLGWGLLLSGTYCTDASGNHSATGTFTVEPDPPPGRYPDATGSGSFTFQDAVGNTTGSSGPWSVSLSGTATF